MGLLSKVTLYSGPMEPRMAGVSPAGFEVRGGTASSFKLGSPHTEVTETKRDPAAEGRPGAARDARASRAAADSVDVERLLPGEEAAADALLPGEDPSVGYRDDVEHWIKVYSELLDFKRFMLDGATARADSMSTDAARLEVQTTDLRVARAEAERFIRRLAFWRGRLDSIERPNPTA